MDRTAQEPREHLSTPFLAHRHAASYRLDEHQQALVLSCLALAQALSRKYSRMYGLDRDDAEDIALTCLCRAAYLFKESLGFKFVSYAWKAICSGLNRSRQQQASRPRMRTGILCVEDEDTDSLALDPADERALTAETQAEIAEKIACLKAVLRKPLFETLSLSGM
jgi:DNA-directed RNA polymerase specialized sigma subunit